MKIMNAYLSADDLSFKANASQSPMALLDLHNTYDARYAVDRNTATCMRTDDIGTNSVHKTMWWKVDLGEVYSIYSITILFKTYENKGMNTLNVIVCKNSET